MNYMDDYEDKISEIKNRNIEYQIPRKLQESFRGKPYYEMLLIIFKLLDSSGIGRARSVALLKDLGNKLDIVIQEKVDAAIELSTVKIKGPADVEAYISRQVTKAIAANADRLERNIEKRLREEIGEQLHKEYRTRTAAIEARCEERCEYLRKINTSLTGINKKLQGENNVLRDAYDLKRKKGVGIIRKPKAARVDWVNTSKLDDSFDQSIVEEYFKGVHHE